MTELEFLKEEREKIKNILKGYDHSDLYYYSSLSVYKSLNEQIDKLTNAPDLR